MIGWLKLANGERVNMARVSNAAVYPLTGSPGNVRFWFDETHYSQGVLGANADEAGTVLDRILQVHDQSDFV